VSAERLRRVVCGLALSVLPSCIASNVVAIRDRAVVQPVDSIEWNADPTVELANGGLFESARISGDAAAHLLKIYYLFETGGRYTAAALVAGESGSSFQTLEGIWELRGRQLTLDGGDPVGLRAAHGGYVELATPAGTVALRRVAEQ
jgi:hypothetical protein